MKCLLPVFSPCSLYLMTNWYPRSCTAR